MAFKCSFYSIEGTSAEKRPFLESGPESVKLTPSWEDRNLPAAELNLRGLESDLDKAALDMDPPPDRLASVIAFERQNPTSSCRESKLVKHLKF